LETWRDLHSKACQGAHFSLDAGLESPPLPLRGFGATAFAWLAEPKLTLRQLA
jgi:hypothetical protein